MRRECGFVPLSMPAAVKTHGSFAHGPRYVDAQVRCDEFHAAGALTKGFFRCRQGIIRPCAAFVRQCGVDLDVAQIVFVRPAQLKARCLATLYGDFGVVDEVVRVAAPTFEVEAVCAVGIAMNEARQFDVLGFAVPTVVVCLVDPRNRSVVIVAAGVEC